MVLSERTRHLITAEDLELMKPTAFFINTSRGPIVDEDALIDVLRRRHIAGAGLDVFDIEPLPLDHPFRQLDNVTLTPHTGYVSDDNYAVSGMLIHAGNTQRLVYDRHSGLRRWITSSAT